MLAAILAAPLLAATLESTAAGAATATARVDSGAVDVSKATAGIAISRKVLPDVQATTVPRGQTPVRPPRLDDPVAAAIHFQEARIAAAAGDFTQAQSRVREALKADPNQPQMRWWFSGESLRRFRPGAFIWSLPVTVRAALSDPLALRRLWIELHQGAVLLTGCFWTALILIYLTVYWRYLSHDMSALLFRDTRHRLRAWTPALFLVAALLARPGWFGYLALLSIGIVVQARGRARWSLVVTWMVAALLLFPHWPGLRQAAPVIDPESETNLLVQASRQPARGSLIRDLEERIERTQAPDRRARLQLALAIQHARAGRYERSSSLLQEVLVIEPNSVPARVNLANNTYYLGKLDAAARGYEEARRLAPKTGEIPYNLAQVYFKKLFVPEASDALKDSRALGFHPPAWEDATGDANGYSPVVYLEPEDEALIASCRREAVRYPPLVGIAAWVHFLGCPPLPLFMMLVATLGLSLALVRWWSNQHDPRGCDNCGVVICRDCCEIRKGAWYCLGCAETADRARSEMVLATLLKNRSRTVSLTRSAQVTLIARFVPGSGHLQIGETGKAVLRAGMLALAFYGIFFAWAFDPVAPWRTPGLVLPEEAANQIWLPLPAAAWQNWTFWPVAAGIVLLVLVYALAQLDGSQFRRRVPDHFLTAAGEDDRAARRAT